MRFRILFILATLLLIQNATTKISKLGDISSPMMLKPSSAFTYERELIEAIDLFNIEYPLTVKSNIGKAITVETPVATKDISGFGLKGVGFTKILSKDIIITGSESTATIVIRVVEGVHGYDGKTYSFTPEFTTTGREDFVCEDAVYISQTRSFYVGCRAPATADKKSAVGLFGLRFNDDNELNKYFELDLEETDGFTIQNRLRLLLQQESSDEFVVYMHDQHVGNAGDKPIQAMLRGFRVLGDAFDVETPLQIEDKNKIIIQPVGFTSFRNEILVVSERTDSQNDVLCLTYLETTKQDDALLLGPAQFTDIPNTGNLLILESGHLISYAQDLIEIRKVSHRFTETQWIGKVYQQFNLTEAGITLKGGLVSAVEFDGDFVANFCDNSNGQNTHNSVLASARLDNSEVINHGEGAVVFNRMLFRVSDQNETFYHMDFPYFSINTDELKDGANDIEIKAWDSEMTEAEAVVVTFTVFIVSEPFAEISSRPKALEVTAFADSILENPFQRLDIVSGNQVNVGLKINPPVDGVENIVFNSRNHIVNIAPERDGIAKYETLNIAPGAMVSKNTNSEEIEWFQCYEQSELETECARVGVTTAFNNGLLDIAGSVLEVVYTVSYDADRDTSYLNWFQFDDEWQYEIYKGKVLGVEHIETESGVVFIFIIFNDHVKVSRFFDDWYYGSRNTQVYYHYDLNSYEFCPTQVAADHNDRENIFVLSSCQDEQEIFQFYYDTETSGIRYLTSRTLGTSMKAPEICVLPTEILVYSQISHQVFTLDYFFGRTIAPVNTKLLGVETITDFVCSPVTNTFAILTLSAGQDTSDIVVFNGGNEYSALTRLRNRLNLDDTYSTIQSFTHQDDLVFLAWEQGKEPYYERLYLESPLLLTSFVKDAFNATQPFNISVVLSNPAEESIHRNHTVLPINVPESTIEAVPNKLKFQQGQAVDITPALTSSGSIIGLRAVLTSVKKIDLGEGFEQAPSGQFQAYSYLEGSTRYEIDHREIGRFQRLSTYDVVAYYTKSTPLHYGVVEIMKDKKVVDSFYSLNSIRHTESIEAHGNVFTVMLNNVGRNSDLNMIWAVQGKYNYNLINLDTNLDYDNLALFIVKDGQGTTASPIEFGLIAHSRFTGMAVLYQVIITGDGQGEFDVIATYKATFQDQIKDYSIAVRTQYVGFYYVQRQSEQPAMIYIDKSTYKFQALPATLMNVGAPEDERLASVSCEYHSSETLERCVFSTYGAMVIYTESLFENGEIKAPQVSTYSLIRYGPYVGSSFIINGRFIMQENDLLFDFEEKRLLVWDINVIKARPESQQFLGTITTIVDMRLPGSNTSKDSRVLDTVLLENGNVEVFMEVEDQPTAQINLISKIVTPWTVSFGNQPWEQVQKYEIGFSFEEDDETLNLLIGDIFSQ